MGVQVLVWLARPSLSLVQSEALIPAVGLWAGGGSSVRKRKSRGTLCEHLCCEHVDIYMKARSQPDGEAFQSLRMQITILLKFCFCFCFLYYTYYIYTLLWPTHPLSIKNVLKLFKKSTKKNLHVLVLVTNFYIDYVELVNKDTIVIPTSGTCQ